MTGGPKRNTRRSITRWVVLVTGLNVVLFGATLAGALLELRAAQRDSRQAVARLSSAADAAKLGALRERQRAVLAEFMLDHDQADVGAYRGIEYRSRRVVARLASTFREDPIVREALASGRVLDVEAEKAAMAVFDRVYQGRLGMAFANAQTAEDFTQERVRQAGIIRQAAEAAAHRDVAHADARLAHARWLLLLLTAAVLVASVLLATLLVRAVARAFHRVSESEERFRTLVANIPGSVYRRPLDPAAPVQFVSDSIEEICGFPASDFLTGRRVASDLLAADDLSRLVEATAAAAQQRGSFALEYSVAHADGGTRWVKDMGQVVASGDGSVVLDGTLSDVTELRRLEQELRVAQKLDAVGQLAAGIAHEINTPVQFVGDSIAFLRQSFEDVQELVADYRELCRGVADGPRDAEAILTAMAEAEERADLEYLSERVPAAFERTVDGVGRVATIVSAMRDFGRPAQVTQAPADLNQALSSTLIVARNAYKTVAELETDFGDLPQVVCNVSDLNQVFLNLIVNAAHAIEDAGAETGTIRVRTALQDTSAVITVADTGSGIPDSVRDRIFDPFFTTKEAGRGTGQGLAIARSIVVDKHRGSLTVESEPGRGTEFEVRLPLAGVVG